MICKNCGEPIEYAFSTMTTSGIKPRFAHVETERPECPSTSVAEPTDD